MSATFKTGAIMSIQSKVVMDQELIRGQGEAIHACHCSSGISRAFLGGLVGTIAITTMMYVVAPMMLGEPMDVARMLGSLLGDSWWAGMAMHFVNGSVVFPLIYALVLYKFLPGTPVVKGLTWGITLWLVSQVAVMPMMGAGFFSGGMMPAMGSLVGHIAYGAILGVTAGPLKSIGCSAAGPSNC